MLQAYVEGNLKIGDVWKCFSFLLISEVLQVVIKANLNITHFSQIEVGF